MKITRPTPFIDWLIELHIEDIDPLDVAASIRSLWILYMKKRLVLPAVYRISMSTIPSYRLIYSYSVPPRPMLSLCLGIPMVDINEALLKPIDRQSLRLLLEDMRQIKKKGKANSNLR
jgi:hypothetical protein